MDDRRNIRSRLKDGLWLDSIPNFGKQFYESSFLEQKNNSWDDIWTKVRESENIMSCISAHMSNKENDIIKPVSLKSIADFVDTLEQWVNDNSDVLTFPATKESWSEAVINTLKKEDMKTFSLLCGAFPDQIKQVVNNENIPDGKIKKWWLSFNQEAVVENKIAEEIDKKITNNLEKTIENQNTGAVEPQQDNKQERPAPDNKKSFKKPEAPYPANEKVQNSIKSLENLRSSIEDSKDVASKLIDEYIMSNTHGKSSNEVTDWFSKVFFSSFQHMEENSVNFFIDNLPSWRERPVEKRPLKNVNVKDVLGDIAFWSSLKFMQKKVSHSKNQEILKTFIPNLLDISNIGFETRLDLGKKMFDFTKKSEDLFRNRLLMWSSMGGSLTEQNNSEKADMFQSKKESSDSMIKWIKESNNPLWDSVVIEYAKEKDLNLHKWYPNDFKSDDLLEFYVSTTPVSRPPM